LSGETPTMPLRVANPVRPSWLKRLKRAATVALSLRAGKA
jgi:hypothetical protein